MALDQAGGLSNVHEKPSCSCLLMGLAGWLVSYHPRPTKIHGGPALFGPLFFPTQDEKSAWADHRGLPRWCSSLSSAEFRSLGWDFFPQKSVLWLPDFGRWWCGLLLKPPAERKALLFLVAIRTNSSGTIEFVSEEAPASCSVFEFWKQ